ncbi:DUF262 domain-containing protein [Salinibacter ruber]|uniref:DUF262 domain-containing protein n=1 Tax=Salinibacter ruber TaxID=146919 RepID=UPI002073BBBE|nr:DUF262 domain-containing protein [Salinibacter ruber]
MPESGTKSLGDVLSSGVYRIPNYQRGYAWTPREVNDFIDDLEYVTDNDGVKSHYVNSVIVTQPENESLVDGLYVIDGQQCLLTSTLVANEILRKSLKIESRDAEDAEHLRRKVDDNLYGDVFKSTRSRTEHRVLPARQHEEIFKRIVPRDVEGTRDLDAAENAAESPSEQKLVGAVRTVRARLNAMLSDRDEGKEQLLYLSRLATTLHDDFIATLHEVKNPAEAGRIFEAINDRGRALNRADKIKSYLVYRTSLGNVGRDVEAIHKTFTNVYEVINRFATDPAQVDNLIDRLIGHHWTMFTNQDQITSPADLVGRHEKAGQDIDQIKYANYHIPKTADDERVGRWIDAYLESLERAAEAYVHFRGADRSALFRDLSRTLTDDVNASKVRHHLYAIEKFGPSTTHSLSMALYLRFAHTEAYSSVLEALEKLVIRMFGVGGARRDTKRARFKELSRALFWSERNDLLEVFPEDSAIPEGIEDGQDDYEIHGTFADAERVINWLNQWTYRYSHSTTDGQTVDEFEERLTSDHLGGHDVAGWSGLTRKDLKNYMLYRYEEAIRGGGTKMPGYLEAGIPDFTVEHVWPQTYPESEYPEYMDKNEYNRYLERLGNLAFLSISENASAGNKTYEVKFDQIYSDAADGTKMVRDEFPTPPGHDARRENDADREGFDTWSRDLIEWRSRRMARVLARHWGFNE